jgi:hypothetical protein
MAMSTQSGENSRYTDLKDEPIDRLLSPIGGYEDKPLVSLAETVKPIATFFNDIQDYVYVALHNCQNPTDNLTQQESASIHLYTMQFHSRPSLYEVLNQSLRAQNRDKLIPWFSFLKLFLTALYKLPSQSGIVWRGIKNVDLSSKYKPGMKIAWWGVSSCTTHIQVLESNAFFGKHGLRTLFSIECINGKSVANHSYFKNTENEIILIPGSYFEVIGHLNPAPQLHIIQLKEITPPITFVKPPFAKSPNIIPFVINRPNTNPQPIANMIAQNTASNGFPQQISLKLSMIDLFFLIFSNS